MLASLSSIAPDSRQQHLITAAAEALSPSDYVDFLNTLCDMIASGTSPKLDIDSIKDGESRKEGFLACNYDDPRVATVIQKIERLSLEKRPNNPEEMEFFAQMKSGKMKENVVQHLKEDGGRTPERFVRERVQAPQRSSAPSTISQDNVVSSPEAGTRSNPMNQPVVPLENIKHLCGRCWSVESSPSSSLSSGLGLKRRS